MICAVLEVRFGSHVYSFADPVSARGIDVGLVVVPQARSSYVKNGIPVPAPDGLLIAWPCHITYFAHVGCEEPVYLGCVEGL